jgi:hypothetical protein
MSRQDFNLAGRLRKVAIVCGSRHPRAILREKGSGTEISLVENA